MSSLMNIGTDTRGVEAMRKAILDILTLAKDRETTVMALQVLRDGVQVSDVTITGCNFIDNPKKTKPAKRKIRRKR